MKQPPLDGVRILDLSRLLPGALATRRLADLGADVVKVEEPNRGDYLRTIPPLVGGVGLMHLVLNRGKRSIALDFKCADHIAALRDLADAADVVVESSRPGRVEDFGLSLRGLRSSKPEIVICSITGFGQTGPLAALPSHGMNIDALAGCAPTRHSGENRTQLTGFISLGVELGGVNAALAIVSALFRAKATGQGGWLDVSCWDAAVEAQRLALAYILATGQPMPDLSELGAFYDVYACRDGGLIMFAPLEEKFWHRFCVGVRRPDLTSRWGGRDVDLGSGADLRQELEAIFIGASAEEWSIRLRAWDIPGTEILDLARVVAHPHLQERGLLRKAPPGEVPQIASPVRYHETEDRPGDWTDDAPALGQHTEEILKEWSAPSSLFPTDGREGIA